MSADASLPSQPAGAAGTRTALIVGPVVTAIGIAWTAIAPSDAASAAVLVGLVTCIVGTHRFGRQGPEARMQLDGDASVSSAEPADGGDDANDAP